MEHTEDITTGFKDNNHVYIQRKLTFMVINHAKYISNLFIPSH